jgi:O-Antigen ligase
MIWARSTGQDTPTVWARLDHLWRDVPSTPRNDDHLRVAALAAFAGSALLGLVAASASPWAFPAAAVITLSIYAVFAWAFDARVGVLALLFLVCALDAFEFSAGPIFVRTEQIAAVIGFVVIVATRGAGRRWWLPSALEWVLLIWFALNVLSSLIAAPQFGASMKVLVLMVLSSAGLLIPRRLNLSQDGLHQAIRLQLLVFAGAAAYGLVALVLAPILHSDFGMTFNRLTKQLVASGSLWESNVFGAYCASGAVAWALLGPRWFSWRSTGLGLGLCFCGVLVSLTRASWVALLLVAVIILVGPLRKKIEPRSIWVAAAMFGSTLVLFSLAEGAGIYSASGGPHRPDQALAYIGPAKATSTPSSGTGSTPLTTPPTATPTPTAISSPGPNLGGIVSDPRDIVGRIQQAEVVFHDLRTHPFFGGGTASYGERYQFQGMQLWIASLPLRVLNDTGIAGFAVFVLFLTLIAATAWRARRDLLATTLGLILLLIFMTNLSTETLELMFTWLFIGVAVAASEISGATKEAATS